MQETSTESSYVKRVSVRTGGAGHAHSGIVEGGNANTAGAATSKRASASTATNGKIVKLGR